MNKLQPIDADTLYYKPLAHPKMLIDGVLSDGLAILAGDSKIGKSWMVLWLCLQISRGEAVWGLPTRKTDVVYLALEDREWRVQQRMQELTDSPPENLRFGFSCGQLGTELEGQIEDAVRFKARMDIEPGFLSELSGMFSNRTEWHPLPMFEATPENCEAFRRWLDSQWAELPEALPTQTAAELVGHSPQRIHEWIREDVLVGIKLGTIQYCAKAEFIGFMASPQRLAHPRTEKYKELIREFKYIQRRERENEQRRQKRKIMKEST